ncbi:MAG: SusC/RagA family TonB-linked outer membrane protein [Bacteroidetes bacterium]|nr:SusC/RagA family TonB-linked outer membrane protein [Bacteroidota bacterium]
MSVKSFLLTVVTAIVVTFTANAQSTVTGTITDENGNALVGAALLVKGTTSGAFSDAEGKYLVNVPRGKDTLLVSYVGYVSQTVRIMGRTVIDIVMESGDVKLDEMVITAIGIPKEKRALGYSVQSVGGSQLLDAKEQNVVTALAGKVAGANVIKSSGMAGGASYIQIRGANTIRGDNQPLFIVDGVPIDNSQLSNGNPDNGRNNYLNSVANSNRAIDIPQEDIESIQILKGAAATALYGSQAGNGAIIITTKKGKTGIGNKGLNISYSGGVDFSKYNKMVPLQNKYTQGIGGVYYGPSTGFPWSWGTTYDSLYYNGDEEYKWDVNGDYYMPKSGNGLDSNVNQLTEAEPYDNVNSFFRRGTRYYNTVSVSGANDKADIYFSIGNDYEQGIVPNNELNKTNISVNSGLKVSDKLSVRSSMKYVNTKGTRIEQGSNTSGVMLGLLRTPPSFDNANGMGSDWNETAYQFADGSQRNFRGGGGYDNPLWTAMNNPLTDDVNRMIGNIEVNYKLNDIFQFTYRPGIDFYSDRRKQYFAIGSNTVSGRVGRVMENQYYSSMFNEDLILSFNKDLNANMNINGLVGHNRRSSYLQQVYAEGNGLTIPGFYHMSNASSTFTRESVTRTRDEAVYASLSMDFRRTIYLTLTGRNEWSSSLPAGGNSFFFPSANLGIVFTELADFGNVLPYGKIRASFAQVGLGSPFVYATDNYYTLSTYADGWTNGVSFPYSGVPGFNFADVLGGAELRPERNNQFEIGAEFKFLDDKFGLDIAYYSSKSIDLIFPVPVAATSGAVQAVMNAGTMTNKGIEVMAYLTPIKQADNGFRWDINLNYTRNRNEVVELAPGVDNVFLGGFTGANIRAQAGSAYGSIYGLGFYKDKDGNTVIGEDGYPIIDPNERSFGSAQPDWLMGISNTFSYKGFRLSGLLDIRQGGVMWNGTKGALYYFGTHADTEVRGSTKVFEGKFATYDDDGNMIMDENGVPVTGDKNDKEVLLGQAWLAFGNGNGFFGDNTEDFVESMSWVRLRELSLSYTLDASLLDKTPFTACQISVSGRNLWLKTDYSGIDPETSLAGSRNEQGMDYFNMPNTKSWGLGVRLTF